MAVDLPFFLRRFEENSRAIAAYATGLSDEQAHWKATPGDWSVVEVISHLADEEREDFRTRVEYTLFRPEIDWPSIDPQGWVEQRSYNQRGLAACLADFLAERRRSIEWLRQLSSVDWERRHIQATLGSMSAQEMLEAWLCHDHLHLRQLNELHWRILARTYSPIAQEYAGGW